MAKVLYVDFTEDSTSDVASSFFANGVQFEFERWVDTTTARYRATVEDWAITSVEQALDAHPAVLSYRDA